MDKRIATLFVVLSCAAPNIAAAETVTCTNSYSGSQTRTYELPQGTLNPGQNQHGSLITNSIAAQADIGKTFYTAEMTVFNDQMCSGGPCNNATPGIAHRTWPLGACVAVCNLQNKECAVAVIMDKGPNTKLQCRTIDANPALRTVLKIQGGIVPATYQLISLRGPCDTRGGVSIPTPDPSRSTVSSNPYFNQDPARSSIVGNPTGGAQSAYYQPADFSNYQQSTPVSPTPYFSSTQPTTGTGATNPLTSTVTRPQSAADFLLSVLQDPNKKGSSTSPFTVTIDGGNKTLSGQKSNATGTVSGTLPTSVSQTFVSPDLSPNRPMVSVQQGRTQMTIEAIVARFSEILRSLRSLFSAAPIDR